VNAKKEPAFNVDTFLATVNGGRTISTYRKGQKVFRQGDPADAVFYLKEGKVKVCVISVVSQFEFYWLGGSGIQNLSASMNAASMRV